MVTSTHLHTTLKHHFGYDQLYPTQEAAISAVLEGKNVVVLMPTGGGKSMCFQLPALVMAGTAVVVSPLIALMKDQVDSLQANGISAAFLNSSQEPAEQAQVQESALAGDLKLLYVSAERLVSPKFNQFLHQLQPSLFAIDEAHCISAWGHDFRPEYTQLSHLRRQFPDTPIMAVTATADRTTRADILTQLELHDPVKLIDSFDRPNISLGVKPGKNRFSTITAFLAEKTDQSGIIYCLTRKKTEQLASKLQAQGYSAAAYHAGLSKPDRSKIQQSFIKDKTQIICATIAFGMGIDKSNIRWVIHYNLPKNIEGYYQEIGRAGRDGAPADSLLLYTYADVEALKKFGLDSKQRSLQLAKLDRMKEYAEGVICRRKIILAYFGETLSSDCGNCDVCAEPYPSFAGTDLANQVFALIKKNDGLTSRQVASALAKTRNKPNFASWQFYLGQLKNAGYLQVRFDRDQSLGLTPLAKKILAGENAVQLVTLTEYLDRQETAAKVTQPPTKNQAAHQELYDHPLFAQLRTVRLELATDHNLPAYMIFSDKTLLEMVAQRPKSKTQMLRVSGVGQVKWDKYGQDFLAVIKRF